MGEGTRLYCSDDEQIESAEATEMFGSLPADWLALE